MMNTLLPGPRVSERHVNKSSEKTKSRNHFEKEQNQRFALQELLKQFLTMSRYITAISYQPKTLRSAAIILVLWWQNNLLYWLQNILFIADIISNMQFGQELPIWEVSVNLHIPLLKFMDWDWLGKIIPLIHSTSHLRETTDLFFCLHTFCHHGQTKDFT